METPDKSLVGKRFRRGLPTYSESAEVQRRMAERLTAMICGKRTDFRSVLEIGAGTGLLTGLLDRSIRWERRIVNDLVEECRPFHVRRRGTAFHAGDAESTEWDADEFDLICSNAVFQWLSDLPSFLKKLHRASAPGGLLAFSTFGPENLNELASLTGHRLHYYAPAEIAEQLTSAGFRQPEYSEEIHAVNFSAPLDILKQMRRTGVSAAAGRVRWTPGRMDAFCREYKKQFGQPDGSVRLTWHPVYFLAVRN